MRAISTLLLVCISLAVSGCATNSPASSSVGNIANRPSGHLFWDWGGSNQVDGSGREIVRFSPQFASGEIVVSFSDRRLYYVTRPQEAISYPIAIPREEDRWQGTTTVSDMRMNSIVDFRPAQ